MEKLSVVYCETCGKAFDLDSGETEIFPCEVCGNGCCFNCFQRKHGKVYLNAMLNRGNYWACDKCFPLYKVEIFKSE